MSIYDIPVMFLTAKGDKASIVRVLALKPADYILKTVDRNSLHLKIDNYFRMK
jgi:DNA-binding response OmpR family regulator